MPVIRNGSRHPERAAALTRRLSQELAHPQPEPPASPSGQPVVYENRIGLSPRYSVTVIWDDWAGMDRVARSRVILDAYEASDPSKAGQISIAMGLTTEDAASMGLLPFAVVPHFATSPPDRRRDVLDRMRREPGVTTSAGGGLEMRFRTLDEASSAAARLRATLTDAEWIVVQSVRPGTGDEDA